MELAEIEAAIEEEHEGISIRDAFLARGNRIRFFIAFFIFFLQQSCGQNSVNYYAPTIFQSIGYTGTSVSLLAAGIYGVIKVIATTLFIYVAVDSLGRKRSLLISAMGMGTLFFILGALLKMFPPDPKASTPSPASKAMAATLYIYVCFYSLGWGPLPWVYSSDIFPTRTRHYGLACASASQWLWSALNLPLHPPVESRDPDTYLPDFVITYNTPMWVTKLGWKLFIVYATINIGVMTTFSLIIPETKGLSLEEMDIIFGSVDAETRRKDIERQQTSFISMTDGEISTISGIKAKIIY